MVLTDHEHRTYAVHFMHIRENVPIANTQPWRMNGAMTKNSLVGTSCTVHEGKCATNKRPCNTPGEHIGTTACSWRDQFVRRVGRKIAFGRALMHYPKPVRAALWADFLRVLRVRAFVKPTLQRPASYREGRGTAR